MWVGIIGAKMDLKTAEREELYLPVVGSGDILIRNDFLNKTWKKT